MTITIIVAVALVWLLSLWIQKVKAYPVAHQLIQDLLYEQGKTDFDKLVAMVGAGYNFSVKEVNSRKYYLGYIITKPGTFNKAIHLYNTQAAREKPGPEEQMDTVEVLGYVDCVSVLPFFYFKFGPSFNWFVSRPGTTVFPWDKDTQPCKKQEK